MLYSCEHALSSIIVLVFVRAALRSEDAEFCWLKRVALARYSSIVTMSGTAEVVMAKTRAKENARGKLQWKEWVMKKEPALDWWERGHLEAATNCSGRVRTYTRVVGSRQRKLKSERQLVLTPHPGGRNGKRVDLRCTVPTWGQTMWHRLVAWYLTARPAGLTKQTFKKRREGEGERFLYQWEVHHGGFNHQVTKWENVAIVPWEDKKSTNKIGTDISQ